MASKRRRTQRRPGITRVDQPSTRTHGFVVRVGWYQRKNGSYGPRFKSFFGDVSHGGKKGSMKAAESWLTKIERTAGKAGRKVKSAAKAGARKVKRVVKRAKKK